MKFHNITSDVCKVYIVLEEHNAQEYAMLAAMFSRLKE